MAENMDAKIVIIGCGIAGIAAAQRLIESGFTNVRILEATGRSGGRIKSSRLGNAVIEIGAAFIHGPSEKNPVFCLARDYDLLDPKALTPENQAVDVDEGPPQVPNWFTSSGQKVSPGTVEPALELFYKLLDSTPQSKSHKHGSLPSVGDFIKSEALRRTSKKWKNKDKSTRQLLLGAINTLLKEECYSSATHSMDELDLVGFSMYQSIKGVDCTFPSGTESLISSLMSELPADLVSYSRPVRCIHWSNSESGVNAVTVECEDGQRISADHVIVTVSLGYLKKHHSTLFSPALPDQKLQSIQKIGFGTCDKILVEFESPWWDADCEIIYLVWDDEEDISDHVSDISKNWIRKISSFTVVTPSERGNHVLCGWISGHEAEHMETLPEEEVRRCITELIHTFTGDHTITPKTIVCTRWFHDPWTLGSYCHPAIGCSAQDFKNMMEPLPKRGKKQPLQVLFAGEATHPFYYSSLHGALLSGQREADRLIAHYS
ncbi:peroxisomal N(1)-acetyl-spermine/spermidine oxidase-like [Girardinichthys multiradiatus]|uniref:peroxisomal N(1)-acetyl-spermine/spermidine oxidase-like n=1 Tax=Girardinichthys multiradiatus TaxID=208333 RepID=UPI001FAD68CF|nr:peroxisomal N(1)-acetyl-spermine/spermidine oxidase-like [Girardinichthys multiradiatus]